MWVGAGHASGVATYCDINRRTNKSLAGIEITALQKMDIDRVRLNTLRYHGPHV